MTEIRFKLPTQNTAYADVSYDDLRARIEAETSQVEFPPSAAPPEGAALADIVIVAIITGGFSVAVAAINAYANYLISRQKAPENKDAFSAPIVLRLRGVVATETIELSSDKEANKKAIKAAVKKLKVVTGVSAG
jgi:hypothetical protein